MKTPIAARNHVIFSADQIKEAPTIPIARVAAYGAKNPEDRKIGHRIAVPLGEGIVGTVAQTGLAEIVSDTQKDPRYIPDHAPGTILVTPWRSSFRSS